MAMLHSSAAAGDAAAEQMPHIDPALHDQPAAATCEQASTADNAALSRQRLASLLGSNSGGGGGGNSSGDCSSDSQIDVPADQNASPTDAAHSTAAMEARRSNTCGDGRSSRAAPDSTIAGSDPALTTCTSEAQHSLLPEAAVPGAVDTSPVLQGDEAAPCQPAAFAPRAAPADATAAEPKHWQPHVPAGAPLVSIMQRSAADGHLGSSDADASPDAAQQAAAVVRPNPEAQAAAAAGDVMVGIAEAAAVTAALASTAAATAAAEAVAEAASGPGAADTAVPSDADAATAVPDAPAQQEEGGAPSAAPPPDFNGLTTGADAASARADSDAEPAGAPPMQPEDRDAAEAPPLRDVSEAGDGTAATTRTTGDATAQEVNHICQAFALPASIHHCWQCHSLTSEAALFRQVPDSPRACNA